jgi:hypothetical protein
MKKNPHPEAPRGARPRRTHNADPHDRQFPDGFEGRDLLRDRHGLRRCDKIDDTTADTSDLCPEPLTAKTGASPAMNEVLGPLAAGRSGHGDRGVNRRARPSARQKRQLSVGFCNSSSGRPSVRSQHGVRFGFLCKFRCASAVFPLQPVKNSLFVGVSDSRQGIDFSPFFDHCTPVSEAVGGFLPVLQGNPTASNRVSGAASTTTPLPAIARSRPRARVSGTTPRHRPYRPNGG